MDNFIYSINATMPVFLIIAAGYFLKRIGFIGSDFLKPANKFAFSVLFPLLLFRDIAKTNLHELFKWDFAAFCFFSTITFFIVVWILSNIFIKEKKSIGSFASVSCRGSAAILGVAFAQNIYGSSGVVPVMIIASVPLFNIFSVIYMTISGEGEASVKKIIKGVITNPLIIGIVCGLPFAFFSIHIPQIIQKPIDNLASMATPLSLIVVGAGFEFGEVKSRIKLASIASIIKLIILPAVFLPIAIHMGFDSQSLVAVLILTGTPTTVASAIMAKNMNNDYLLASETVIITTLFSAFTITAIIFILKSFNLI